MKMNKLVTIVHGNSNYLGFAYNKKLELIGDDWGFGRSISTDKKKYGPAHPARLLHDAVMQVNLVKECDVRPYELSVEIPDGFDEDQTERDRVYREVGDIIRLIHFGGEDVDLAQRDTRPKYRSVDDADFGADL